MQADVLVLDHDPTGRQAAGHQEVLVEVEGRGHQALPQVRLLAIVGEGDAVDRADVDAGVALYA